MCSVPSCEDFLQRLYLYELGWIAGRVALEPSIARAIFRFTEAIKQRLLRFFRRVHGFLADLLDSYPFDEVVGALEIIRLFPVVLEKQGRRFQSLLRSFDGDQQISLADFLPR